MDFFFVFVCKYFLMKNRYYNKNENYNFMKISKMDDKNDYIIINNYETLKYYNQNNVTNILKYLIKILIYCYLNNNNEDKSLIILTSVGINTKTKKIKEKKSYITLKYKIKNNTKDIKLFGKKFVENNHNKCKIIIEKTY